MKQAGGGNKFVSRLRRMTTSPEARRDEPLRTSFTLHKRGNSLKSIMSRDSSKSILVTDPHQLVLNDPSHPILLAFGQNKYHELGLGQKTESIKKPTFVPLSVNTRAEAVACSNEHAMLLT